MTERELNKRVEQILKSYDDVNRLFIRKVAENIKKIGHLNASSINRISIMASMNADINEITQAIAKAADLSTKELRALYEQALNDTYTDKRFQRALSREPLAPADRRRLEWYTQAATIQTAGALRNLSNTTIVSKVYQDAIDTAILAVVTGGMDYKSATRDVLRNLGMNGLQVEYPSGYHRRADSAIRQNITNGAKQIAQDASLMMGEALGYDAVEISAHAMSAPDHEPIQGRVFLLSEFEKMQSEQPFQDIDGHHFEPIKRAIGEWNCMHVVSAFSTEFSKRAYTDKQLKDWAEDNARGCEYGDKHYTTYQASQRMRLIETKVRHLKDTAIGAKEADDPELRRECQRKISALMADYNAFATAAELRPHPDRMYVSGYRTVKS